MHIDFFHNLRLNAILKMPDNIALLRSGFGRVIFHKKAAIKAALRKYTDE